MTSAIKKARTTITVLYLCFILVAEGKPQLYSCDLKITNGSLQLDYTCNHDFEISDDGAKIPDDGIGGYITDEPGCACDKVEPPNGSWAAVVKYGNDDIYEQDCSINQKVHSVMEVGYRLVLLVSASDCIDGNNSQNFSDTNYDISAIPIIYTQYPLSNDLLRYSQPTSEAGHAAYVYVTAMYVDFALLWMVFGVTVAITVTCTVCCFCIFFVFRGLAAKFRRQGLSRWSLRKLPQRKYVKGKETYETCAICLEEFENADTIRVLPCSHIYHSKCVDEWLMKWNRICPICKRLILRNERNEDQVEVEETDPTSAEAAASPSTSSADNISDSRTVESIPLLVTVHESTENWNQSYGSMAETGGEGSGSQYLLEPFASMQNDTMSQDSEERSNNIPSAESDHTVTV